MQDFVHQQYFGDNSTHYKTKSVNFLGLMNSATKNRMKVWVVGSGVCSGKDTRALRFRV